MKKVLICGYYGFKNLGDEALLKVTVDMVKQVEPSVDVEALTYDINYTTNFLGIKGFSRESIFSLIKKINSVDVVVLGGGSLLQDATSSKSIMYYLGIVTLSKWLGKKVGIIGNGYGPVTKPFNKWLVRRILKKVDEITIRDKKEYQVLKDMGIKKNISLSADLAMLLTSDIEKGLEVIKQLGLDVKKPIVGISLRPWNLTEDFYQSMTDMARKLHEEGNQVLFLPMQQNTDVTVCRRIIDQLDFPTYIVDFDVRPEVMAGIVGATKFLVGMRLHALIFAAIQGVPMLGIEYNPKIRTFLEDANQPLVGRVDEMTSSLMLNTLENFNLKFDEYKSNIKDYKHKKENLNQMNTQAMERLIKSSM